MKISRILYLQYVYRIVLRVMSLWRCVILLFFRIQGFLFDDIYLLLLYFGFSQIALYTPLKLFSRWTDTCTLNYLLRDSYDMYFPCIYIPYSWCFFCNNASYTLLLLTKILFILLSRTAYFYDSPTWLYRCLSYVIRWFSTAIITMYSPY